MTGRMGRSIEDGAVVKAHVLVYIIIYSTYVCMYVFCLSVTNDIFKKKNAVQCLQYFECRSDTPKVVV